jgi:phytoene dehydrogenase-like protein
VLPRERDFEPPLASIVGKHPLGTSRRPRGRPAARPGWYGKAVEDAMSEIKTIGIIGGGLSGLAAGVSLLRQGFRVKLFEANEKIGGCCANTQLDRWTEEAKDAVAESAIMALSKIHKMDIAVRRVQSPKDYQERLHLFGGALYGLSPAADPRAQFPHKTPIAGLFQAGQTTYPGYGVGTAVMPGVFAAKALMKTVHR